MQVNAQKYTDSKKIWTMKIIQGYLFHIHL